MKKKKKRERTVQREIRLTKMRRVKETPGRHQRASISKNPKMHKKRLKNVRKYF